MSAERVREYLLSHGVTYETDDHPLAFTAQEVAAAEHVPGAEVAKPVMVMADDRLVMLVLPAPRHVDLEKAAAALGCATVRLATEEEFAPAFPDCERGAEPPIGGLYGIPTYVDAHLDADHVVFNGGSHTQVIRMTRTDYLQVARPRIVDVAVGV